MAKKKTKKTREERHNIFTGFAPLLQRDLTHVYFGASIDVPDIHTVSKLHAKSLKLRKAGIASINNMLAVAYREGYKKGEDKAAERAKESAHGTLRANERNMRNANRVVAEAITLLSNVLRNNEVYGRDTDGGVLTVCD